MDKKVLKEILRVLFAKDMILSNDSTIIDIFSKKVDDESFLKNNNEIFDHNALKDNKTSVIVLKDITENMKKAYKNFLYAFEIINFDGNNKTTKFGFIINSDENIYSMIYVSTLESLIDLYYQKDTDLIFTKMELTVDEEGKILSSTNKICNKKQIKYYKSEYHYNIFKNEYLDYYINKNNLKLRKLVTNIFD